MLSHLLSILLFTSLMIVVINDFLNFSYLNLIPNNFKYQSQGTHLRLNGSQSTKHSLNRDNDRRVSRKATSFKWKRNRRTQVRVMMRQGVNLVFERLRTIDMSTIKIAMEYWSV